MATKVTITKAERAAIEHGLLLLRANVSTSPEGKLADKRADVIQKLLEKLDRAELPKPKGLAPQTIHGIAREVLGNRLISPPSAAAGVWGSIARRASDLGLTSDQVHTVCTRAGKLWKGTIRLESIIRQADKLLTEVEDNEPVSQPGFTSDDWEAI